MRQRHVVQIVVAIATTVIAGRINAAQTAPTLDDPSSVFAEAGEDQQSLVLSEGATIDDYLRYAALHNAGLRAAYYEWVSAREQIPQAEALPDPRLSYGYYFQEVETRVGAQRHRIGVSQTLPWVGKLALRGDVAGRAAEAARQRFEAKRLALFYRVKDAYAEHYYLAREIDVSRENVQILTYWEALARAKYRVATGKHPDVIKAQVELGKLTDRVHTLEDLRAPIVARLNEALGRASTEPVDPPAGLPKEDLVVDTEALLAQLALDNPELKSLQATIAARERGIELAKKDYFPDLTFGVQWIGTDSRASQSISDNGRDPVIGTVSINLPLWWQKYGAGVRQAKAERLAALHVRDDRARELSTRLQLALYHLRDAERKIDLYGNGLIPKAEEALQASFTAYESDNADFLDILEAQRVLLGFRLAHERALADHVRYVAEVEMLVGKSLPRQDSSTRTDDHEGVAR